MEKRFVFKMVIIICMFAGIISCTKEKGINSNFKVFNVAKFRQGLITRINTSASTQPRGFSFVINQGGHVADSFSTGIANTNPSNGSSIPMTTNTQVNIASVTKLLTGVAVMQLIKARGLTIDSKISSYLPAYWNAKTAVKNLTFRELMTHSSGIRQSNTSWDSIQATCARGLDDPGKTADVYSNMNFAIFRAIIPFMLDQATAVTNENNMNQNDFEDWMEVTYIDYMQDNVFTPIGISNANPFPNPSKLYAICWSESNSVPASFTTRDPGDWTSICGGGGYVLTTLQMAQCMAYIAQTTILLDQDQKNLMDELYMGWDNEDSFMTYAGRAHGKDGALWYDTSGNSVQDAGDAGLQTFVVKFPNNVELALSINSIAGSYRSLNSLVKAAYDNAWE